VTLDRISVVCFSSLSDPAWVERVGDGGSAALLLQDGGGEAGEVRDSTGLPLLFTQWPLPLVHRQEEPGDDKLSPHIRGIKTTYQETLVLLLSLTWQNR
jgi:hypothetical protein